MNRRERGLLGAVAATLVLGVLGVPLVDAGARTPGDAVHLTAETLPDPCALATTDQVAAVFGTASRPGVADEMEGDGEFAADGRRCVWARVGSHGGLAEQVVLEMAPLVPSVAEYQRVRRDMRRAGWEPVGESIDDLAPDAVGYVDEFDGSANVGFRLGEVMIALRHVVSSDIPFAGPPPPEGGGAHDRLGRLVELAREIVSSAGTAEPLDELPAPQASAEPPPSCATLTSGDVAPVFAGEIDEVGEEGEACRWTASSLGDLLDCERTGDDDTDIELFEFSELGDLCRSMLRTVLEELTVTVEPALEAVPFTGMDPFWDVPRTDGPAMGDGPSITIEKSGERVTERGIFFTLGGWAVTLEHYFLTPSTAVPRDRVDRDALAVHVDALDDELLRLARLVVDRLEASTEA